MKKITKKELKMLQQMCSLDQTHLKKLMSAFLRTKYSSVFETEDFIVAKGDIPIALVAHMDTVFSKPPTEFYFDSEKSVLWSPQGLGADDRAGIFSIMTIVKSGLRPHIILTTDEEMGGIGASALIEYEIPFDDLRYLIQLDRRGSNDCVFYDCINDEFTEYVESFGFSEAWGSFSDISIICPDWGIAGVNLSVGYQNEHSTHEILNISHMLNTISKVQKMLSESVIPFFEYKADKDALYWQNYCKSLAALDYEHIKCKVCGQSCDDQEVFTVRLSSGEVGFYCSDCIDGKVGWCENCYEAFELEEDEEARLCPYCKEAMI